MRFFSKAKDGGPKSPVDGYFLIEIKSLFSIVLLKFNKGMREDFHTHAFNAWTWFLTGNMYEETYDGIKTPYIRSIAPKCTPKSHNHRVRALEDSWCISLRGPWSKTWTEDNKKTKKKTTFTHGRKIVNESSN